MTGSRRQKSKPLYRLTVGSLFVIVGCTLSFMVPWIIKYIWISVRTLEPNGKMFELWEKNPIPLYYEFYMFNWTNPEDIHNPHVKPRFQEIGPFVFETKMKKVNITWNRNHTVTYQMVRYWYFDEAKSVANLSTNIVTVNAVALSGAYSIRYRSYFINKGFDFSLRTFSQKLHIEKPVGQLIFDGYRDPIVDVVNSLPFNFDVPNMDKFAWFYERNGSSTFDGVFNAGIRDDDLGKIYQWNYADEMSYYNGTCNKIKGSTGEFYRTPLKKEKIVFFWPEVCRSVPMDYVGDVSVDGISGYKYVVGESFFDNGSKIFENRCYENGVNIPYGVLNVSLCKYGAPGFLSLPHFYSADPYYTEKVEGLHPNKTKHEMFSIHEPFTGVPLRGEARFQLNMLLQPMKYISMFQRVPTVYLPVLWIEVKGEVPSLYIFLLKTYLNLPLILHTLGALLVALGLCFIGFGVRERNSKMNNLFMFDHEKTCKNECDIDPCIKISLLTEALDSGTNVCDKLL